MKFSLIEVVDLYFPSGKLVMCAVCRTKTGIIPEARGSQGSCGQGVGGCASGAEKEAQAERRKCGMLRMP